MPDSVPLPGETILLMEHLTFGRHPCTQWTHQGVDQKRPSTLTSASLYLGRLAQDSKLRRVNPLLH